VSAGSKMKPTINQALVNQFNGIYKGIGLLGLSALFMFLVSLLESDDTSSISSILSVILAISLVIGAAGYFFSAVLDFETIEGYANKTNGKNPTGEMTSFCYIPTKKQ
jgi:amino acid permease